MSRQETSTSEPRKSPAAETERARSQSERRGTSPQGFGSASWAKLKWPLIALGLVLLFNFFFTDNFFHLEIKNGRLYGSLVDILNRATPVMLVSLGMTLVIATAGVDLSVGAVMAITGTIGALLITATNLPVPVIVLISLGAALLAGMWNGALVAWFGVAPIIATLILMVSGRGIAQLLSRGQNIYFENPAFESIGRGSFLGLPITISITLLMLGILMLLTKRTAAGLFIESTGENETASRYSGVNTRLVKFSVYAISGFCAGLAGIIVTADIKAAEANSAGLWLELDAILAVVIGGTALTGGRFYLVGALIGAILIQTLTTTILMRGVDVNFTLVIKAVVIIAVCLLQSENFRKILSRRRQA